MARDRGVLGLQAQIKVRITHLRPPADVEAEQFPEGWSRATILDGGDHPGSRDVQRPAARGTTRSSTASWPQEALRPRSSTISPSATR